MKVYTDDRIQVASLIMVDDDDYFLLLTFIRKKYTVLCMDKSNVDKKIMDSKRLDKSHSRIEILKQAGFMQLLDLN